jgi:hypothetical protein
MVAKVPELRGDFLHRRWFLTPRSAAFDLALLGAGAAVAVGVALSPVLAAIPLLAAVPYARAVGRTALRWRRRAPLVATAELAADAVGFAAMVGGSIARRSMVL